MVQLKAHIAEGKIFKATISIPIGSIKRKKSNNGLKVLALFQFLLVQLKGIWHAQRGFTDIFQFLLVQLKEKLKEIFSEVLLFQFLLVQLKVNKRIEAIRAKRDFNSYWFN